MSSFDDHDHPHELVMPFVITESQGGPFDDMAFVAGWQCATIKAALAPQGAEWRGQVFGALLPQLDLIAMQKQLVCEVLEQAGEWTLVRIGEAPAVD